MVLRRFQAKVQRRAAFSGLRKAENRRKTGAIRPFSGWLRTMTGLALDITGLDSRGQGLAQLDGQTITVPFALPGERIVAEVDNGRGAIVEIMVSSSERRAAACRHFTACGG